MKTTRTIAALFAASLLLPAAVLAQETSEFSGRLGYFYPTSSFTQASGGKSWIAFGADYRLFRLKSSNEGSEFIQLSVDLLEKGNYRNLPVTLNYVVHTGELYFLGGAGASWTKFRNIDDENEEKIRLAYQVGLGYELRQFRAPLFLELKWMGTSESQFNGWGFFLGARF